MTIAIIIIAVAILVSAVLKARRKSKAQKRRHDLMDSLLRRK